MHKKVSVVWSELKKTEGAPASKKSKPAKPSVVAKAKPKAKYNTKLQTDPYEWHQKAAKKIGVQPIADHAALKKLEKAQKLTKVKNNKGYRVNKLSHSHALLVPKAHQVLNDIGEAFQAKAGSKNIFTVTSITRTEADQKRLRKKNRNATYKESSHVRGVSFDISYIRFNGKKEWNSKLQNALESVLLDFQNHNKIYVIKEKNQSCYHITVR